MFSESEEWVSVAFISPRSFIILTPHSHLFIYNNHLQTPSTHLHCPIAQVSPPSPLFPPSLSLLWGLPCSISLFSHLPLLLLSLRVGSDEWLSLIWVGKWNWASEWEVKCSVGNDGDIKFCLWGPSAYVVIRSESFKCLLVSKIQPTISGHFSKSRQDKIAFKISV